MNVAGPVAQILFATAATTSWQAILDDILGSLGPGQEANSIQVVTTRPIGGLYNGTSRPFLIDIDDELPWAEPGLLAEAGEARVFYERVFGLCPDSAVTVSAMCNEPEDHRILADIALCLAQRLGGIIDMGGLIVPRHVFLSTPDFWNAPWPAVQSRVQAFTKSMPGTAVALAYRTASGREWAWHTVDAAFLQAWLRHPEFRMIK